MSFCGYVTEDNLNKLSGLLLNNYNKGNICVLSNDEETVLNDLTKKLSGFLEKSGLKFNSDNFKELIKKIYPKNNQMGGDDELVLRNQKKVQGLNKYDFFAVLSLIASFFLFYVAFINFNNLLINTTGMDLADITGEVKNDIMKSIDEVNNMSKEEITYFAFIYKSINIFACSFVGQQQSKLLDLLKIVLQNTLTDSLGHITEYATNVCTPSTQILDDQWGILGKVINYGAQSTNVLINSGKTSNCITSVSSTLLQEKMRQQQTAIQLITTQISTQTSQIHGLLYTATLVGYGASSYLLYRLKQLNLLSIQNRQSNSNVSNGTVGGKSRRKSKKTRTNKKSRNHSRNIRSRRYKRHRKSRK